jgi:hypothetical protein
LVVFLFRKSALFSCSASVQDFKKLRRRFLLGLHGRDACAAKSFLPASFAFLTALVFVSGLLYAPNCHTGLSYRLPRVLQWLQHGRWFWIHTANYRMNDRSCGIEWLTAPLLLFLKSDRALFLLNVIPFVLMPGLIFSLWTRLGVRPRVAWWWMWLAPTGYCFLIQAGGIANDAFPTVYALAMMDFALREWNGRGSRVEGRGSRVEGGNPRSAFLNPFCSNLGLSLLSAALMVGAKASNLPLGLPWALVFFPALARSPVFVRCFLRNRRGGMSSAASPPFHGGEGEEIAGSPASRSMLGVRCWMLDVSRWSFVLLIAIVVSFLPNAILNIYYLHDWSGLSIEHSGMDMKNPMAGILGNALLLVTNNFVPTFFPMAGWWNEHALEHFPRALVRLMNANFEGGYNILGEMPTEDSSGIGFGVSVLMVVSVVAGFWKSGFEFRERRPRSTFLLRAVLVAPWISLLAYCMKSGMVTPARLIAPYYPLLFPALLMGAGQSQVVRRGWWRLVAGGVLALALAALILNPSRPLWPAQTILSRLRAAHPNQRQLLRAQTVYQVYANRPDPLAGMRQWFPPGLKVIGFMGTGDDLDISLWKPYGSRRVQPFLFEDSPEKIRELGIEYAVVSGLNLDVKKSNIEEWLQRSGAELLETTNATLTVSQGPEPWYFVRFKQ